MLIYVNKIYERYSVCYGCFLYLSIQRCGFDWGLAFFLLQDVLFLWVINFIYSVGFFVYFFVYMFVNLVFSCFIFKF